ncbi:ATP-binding protein [Methylobacterium nonmethylotrophicum]|uniref:ATP-binding protein n=1 Tax=Methylobacterium nonmethylotrophicum TaxID=1141884 RepID=A0A4Z0NVQ2_9HYPH|nr:ATP-binding protein [Methylobacterium nonmethylotrophicum]TGE00742.1 ATP-binding protein [Methylobacterium nonmethylotrophicum]
MMSGGPGQPERAGPGTTPGGIDGRVDRARRFAALSVSYDPEKALEIAGVSGLSDRLSVAGALSVESDTDQADGRWRLRPPARARILQALKEAGALDQALAERETQPDYTDAADLCHALAGRDVYAEDSIARLVGAVAADAGALQRAASTLALAGPAAPAADRLPALQLAASAAEEQRPDPLLRHGIVGREPELARILAHCRAAWTGGPQALFIGGVGGVGKSTILAETVRRLKPDAPLVVSLDFDRPSLDGLDVVGLSLETARQLSVALGARAAPLREARLKAAGAQSGLVKAERRTPPTALLQEVGRLVQASGRPVLVILDTVEVLAARGDSHPLAVFEFLGACRDAGVVPLAILAAGRGDVPALIRDRVEALPPLTGLDERSASDLVQRLDVPSPARPALLALARGNPLVLRLGARLVAEAGPGALDESGLAGHASERIVAGQLYRLVLSRLSDPELRAIAHPGLLLRRLNAGLIREVLAPELGLGPMTEPRAAELLDELRRHAWLVEEAGGWVSHRSDLREVMLPLQLAADPVRARRLNRLAAAWFDRLPEPWAPREALYHRLQAVRSGGRLPPIDPAVAEQFDDAMLADLGQRPRDAVLLARGGRSSFGRAGTKAAPTAGSTLRAASELRSLLDQGEVSEAAGLASRTVAEETVDPLSSEADVLIEAFWRIGDWARARRLLRRRDQAAPSWPLPPVDSHALAQMQLRAEFTPDAVRIWLARHRDEAARLARLVPHSRERTFGGPLAFLLLAAGAEAPQTEEAAIWSVWTDDARRQADFPRLLSRKLDLVQREAKLPPDTAALAETLIAQAEREGGPPRALAGRGRDLMVRLLAVGSPYAQIAGERWRASERHHLQDRLAAIAALFTDGILDGDPDNPDPSAGPDPPAGPFAAERLDARGRLSEWLGALAFYLPDADNRLLARAAERRRRSAAGAWAYGRAPKPWRPRALDATQERRLDALLGGAAPERRALERLRAWGDLLPGKEDPAQRVLHRLESLLGTVGQPLFGSRRERALAVAAGLARAGAPVALLPELAIHLTGNGASAGPGPGAS